MYLKYVKTKFPLWQMSLPPSSFLHYLNPTNATLFPWNK